MGKISAVCAAANLRMSYTGLRLAILAGIYGGVPNPGTEAEVLLGDVIINTTIIQHDFGRMYPGRFLRKDTLDDNLGRPNRDVRALVATFQTTLGRGRLRRTIVETLTEIQNRALEREYEHHYQAPAAGEDVLFRSHYLHAHREQSGCICRSSAQSCPGAVNVSCAELGCDPGFVVRRARLDTKKELERQGKAHQASVPRVILGCVGSGDMVMESGEDRERIAKENSLVAFEMEGAGVWDKVPCLVVKGVCDYADSHKNKRWQHFATATGAAATKAILGRYIRTDTSSGNHPAQPSHVSATRAEGPVFNGPISRKNVVAGLQANGGTTNLTFGDHR